MKYDAPYFIAGAVDVLRSNFFDLIFSINHLNFTANTEGIGMLEKK